MDRSSLGNRMKGYESVPKNYLISRMPVIIRLDGKAFHSLTKYMDKPYDNDFKKIMLDVAYYLATNIQNCKLAYVQSDEISLLLVDYGTLETDAWYANNIQKMVSVSASLATAKFNELFSKFPSDKVRAGCEMGMFDSRAFNIPREEVVNYFLWRQNDATRNSIQGLGQANYSQKQMNGLRNDEVQEKLFTEKGINWNDTESYFKRGGVVFRGSSQFPDGIVTHDIPIFSKDRDYIEHLVYLDEDKDNE